MSAYLTVQQVADLAQVEHKTVRRAINLGDLQAFKVGSRVRIREDAARDWIEGRPVVARPEPAPARRQPQRSAPRRHGAGSVALLKRMEEAST